MKKQTATIEEAATALGIGRNSAYAAARTGEIHTIKVGKRILVPLAALQEMLTAPERSAVVEKKERQSRNESLERRVGKALPSSDGLDHAK